MNTYDDLKPIFRKGKKVILRPVSLTDVALLTKWMNDPEITQYLNRRTPVTEFSEEEWIRERGRRSSDIVLVIETHEHKAIGVIGLHKIQHLHGTAVTGTTIGEREYHGRGYGSDAKMLLLDFAFNQLNLRKISSAVHAFNGRSLRYAEKCGYRFEARLKAQNFINGTYHDEILLAVFREDWLPLWERYKKDLV